MNLHSFTNWLDEDDCQSTKKFPSDEILLKMSPQKSTSIHEMRFCTLELQAHNKTNLQWASLARHCFPAFKQGSCEDGTDRDVHELNEK
jgi:hypothetical protein